MAYSRKVRQTVTTLRNQVVKAEPDFVQKSNRQVEYEFSNGRKFSGNYKHRGAYEDDE